MGEPVDTGRRWNIDRDGDDLLICFDDHDKGEKCGYVRYVPASALDAVIAERDAALVNARRYLWLRDTDHKAAGRESFDITFYDHNEQDGPYEGSWNTWSMDELDEMIDAAMAAKAPVDNPPSANLPSTPV